MMRLEVRYVTTFKYPEPVRESHNVLRARPADDAHQRVMSYDLSIDPEARVFSYEDYWGTWVDAFGIRGVHDVLVVRADSIVESSPRPAPDGPIDAAAWTAQPFAGAHHQYLGTTRHTAASSDATSTAKEAWAGDDAVATVHNVCRLVHHSLEYVPGSTYVGMDVNDVVAQGAGVCQDFAHVALAMYRSLGIPARYVSGYFYAADQATGDVPEPAEIEVQTHAWVEVSLPGFGWLALDPTNASDVGMRHVKIGHGRDYDDVLPLRGVYHGQTEGAVDVSVRISRDQMSRFRVPEATLEQ